VLASLNTTSRSDRGIEDAPTDAHRPRELFIISSENWNMSEALVRGRRTGTRKWPRPKTCEWRDHLAIISARTPSLHRLLNLMTAA
jgi:hypothetical protein